MRSLRLQALHTYPELQERPKPAIGPGEALVRLSAAALNHRDLYITKGQYPGIKLPITLGSDGVGDVVEVGDAGAHWQGQNVVLCPSLDWGSNEAVQSSDYSILGLPRDGTFADYISVPVECLFAAPEHLSPETVAAIPIASLTAWRALMTRGQLRQGENVLITGIGGGVAIAALQLALAHGARVFVTSSKEEKIKRASALGAHGGVLYTQQKWSKALASEAGHGFDVIIDGAGGEGFGDLARLLNPGGRLVFYGGTNGKWPRILPQHLFFKQVSILASTMGSPKEFGELLDFVGRHKIIPVVDSITPLENSAEAFEKLEAGEQFGKLVLSINR